MMNVWGMTDVGLVRRENQDAYAVRFNEKTGHLVAVVCDGMGGPKGGRLASTLAVEIFLTSCLDNLNRDMSAKDIERVTSFAIDAANSVVFQRSTEEPFLRGMGTTLVSAVVWDDQALLNNVGDSRAYLWKAGDAPGLRQITHDHSLVERLVQMGSITPEEARTHPGRNLITRALGPDEQVSSDSFTLLLAPSDCLLLCSDGLVEMVTDGELEREIMDAGHRSNCLARLLTIAKGRGATDNVTAVLLEQL